MVCFASSRQRDSCVVVAHPSFCAGIRETSRIHPKMHATEIPYEEGRTNAANTLTDVAGEFVAKGMCRDSGYACLLNR